MDKERNIRILLIAAAVNAAIRLQGQQIAPGSRLSAVIRDAVQQARTVEAHIHKLHQSSSS
jgi:hypothetical protein